MGALLFEASVSCLAQGGLLNRFSGGMGGSQGGSARSDSIAFEHRDDSKNAFTITYKYLDSVRVLRPDTAINDYYKYFSIPVTQQYLGNNGSAGYSLIFSPYAKAGWDAGFHAYDVYKFTIEGTKFYTTNKPFTQLGYQLASGKEQLIQILHTQNPRPNINFGFDYRLVNAPGFFVTQNTNHGSLRFFGKYQAPKKRYGANFIFLSNSIKASENGGIQSDSFLNIPIYSRRFTIPVKLGGAALTDPNPFVTAVNTGNIYKNATLFLRQYYDFGIKDSAIINDSTTEYLFYSKLRLQHTFSFNTHSYQFRDINPDTALYIQWYDTAFSPSKDFILTDKWKIISNDFSIIQFPDSKNQGQYLLAGLRLENISGRFNDSSTKNFYNIVLRGEYRNKSKNKLWDILATGELYSAGFNSGDYNAYISLSRYLNKKWGNVSLLFNNINRSPSFIYNTQSAFNFKNSASYNKENILVLRATADNPFISLSATNYFITNYLYFKNYYETEQYDKVVNLLQLSAAKKIRLGRRWNWYADVTLQQQANTDAPVRVPLLFTRNRLAFEGLFFKNLNLSTGIEMRYYTPYKGYDYSPVMGQFVLQDSFTIRNRPDIHLFMHFRIKSFTGYLRTENINTASLNNGFGFTHNNFAAPFYVYPGLLIRFGIQWNFVN
ncbi:MAG TPA: hypothetical protein PKC39_08150 [Ferruginibacter sp.]|nr:hypothetical protein [Ferruginibacter sp.]HMP20916.1 hypothetical protein [Ferruginibacter sp.]